MDLLFCFPVKIETFSLRRGKENYEMVFCPPRFDERMKKKNTQKATMEMEKRKVG